MSWAKQKTSKPGDDYWPWYRLGIRPVALMPLPEPQPRDEPAEVASDDRSLGDFSNWSEADLNACRLWMGG